MMTLASPVSSAAPPPDQVGLRMEEEMLGDLSVVTEGETADQVGTKVGEEEVDLVEEVDMKVEEVDMKEEEVDMKVEEVDMKEEEEEVDMKVEAVMVTDTRTVWLTIRQLHFQQLQDHR